MSFKKNLLRLSGLVALCSAPAMSYWHLLSPAMSWLEVDMASSTSNFSWSTWTTPGGSSGTKYFNFQLWPKPNGTGQCYDMYVDGDANDDVRLWTSSNASIDDDGPGHKRPTARMWITTATDIKVSAYSSAYNSIGFYINTSFVTATSAAACDDGVKPFYNRATNTILRANTTAN